MKKYKFKTNHIQRKDKVIITFLITAILSLIMITKISASLSDAIINSADALIKRENTMLFKKAFSKKDSANVDVEKLITVEKNKKDEIVSIDFNIKECERLMINIVDNMNDGTNKISEEGYIMYIPLGYITNSPLLLNLGPKIPLKITTTDVVLGDVRTKVKEFGINNALIEIYINFEVETNAILPLKSGTTKQNYTALVASKIINGAVPSFYNGGFDKQSETINLPIN